MHLAAGALGEVVARLYELRFVAAGDQHAYAFFEQLARRLVSDAARSAGDDSAAALDSQIHSSPPFALTLRGLAGSIPGNAAAG